MSMFAAEGPWLKDWTDVGTCRIAPDAIGAPTDVGPISVMVAGAVFGSFPFNNVYPADEVDPALLTAGALLTFTAGGGKHPGFTEDLTFPTPIVADLPPQDPMPVVYVNVPITVTWIPDEVDEDFIHVQLWEGGGAVTCAADDRAGSVTIPAELMMTAGFVPGVGSLIVSRVHRKRFIENGGEIDISATSGAVVRVEIVP